MNFKILPYTEVDGIRTVPDSQIKQLFNRTVQEGLDKIVFYEGTIQTEDRFLSMTKSQGTYFYLLFGDEKLVGYTWLNRFENRAAKQHYCIFKEYWGKSIDIGRFVLEKFLNQKDSEGNYLLDLLTGYVPEWNKKAINFSLKCGGKTHGLIPNAIFNQVTQKSEPAMFIYYTRGDT